MAQEWSVDGPQVIDVTGVRRLSLRLVAGQADVVTSTASASAGGGARVEVHEVGAGAPLWVSVADDGTLSVVHERLTWGGLLQWVRGPSRARAQVSISIPHDAEVELGVVSADATVSGVTGRTNVRSVSGAVTLDGCAGEVTAETVSGSLQARSLDGQLHFKSVSGELTVVDGSTSGLSAQSVSGEIVLDLMEASGDLDLKSVSGDMTLRLPADASLRLEAKTVTGDLTASGFDEVTHDGKPGSNRLTAVIGGGSSELVAKSVSGSLTVMRRDA